MKSECQSVRVNPNMKFTTNDFFRMFFGKDVHGFAEEIRTDTTGKYDFLWENPTSERT